MAAETAVTDPPVVTLQGAGDIRRAHGPDEYVDVADPVAMAPTLAVAAVRYCGG